MKKLADLYFNYNVQKGEYIASTHANMQEKDTGLVEDLMRNSKLTVKLNNACKNINNLVRTEKDIKVSEFDVNMSSAVSTASMVRVVVTLLKLEDESDLMVSLFSMVSVPF
jgi:hypothetical protein